MVICQAYSPQIFSDQLTLYKQGGGVDVDHNNPPPPLFSDLPTALHISKWEIHILGRCSQKVKFRYKYYTEITVGSL